MASDPTPSAAAVLVRGLRQCCPRCGEGTVFAAARGLDGVESCAVCGWLLVRSEGHWIGGAELNIVGTFTVGMVVAGGLTLAAGFGPLACGVGAVAMIAFSLGTHRTCRALFYALDYLIDPTPDEEGPSTGFDRDPEDDGPTDHPRPVHFVPHGRRQVRGRSPASDS